MAPADSNSRSLLNDLDDSPVEAPVEVRAGEYVVVARRYRPQTFEELIGQQHVARALTNAIATSRVGHAYLFTGARGVGKTSAARILAKALNCERGASPTPCNECDICQSISAGSDVDVLEIDGASNRGIDEIRQLRQNVNIRPSRARFKIYIIDEVHMLTREAFNALLKTLEEPPEHVKFIFCTTEASKIPITILSRCQRFDFAGIRSPSIVERLRQIVAAEGVTAEPEALDILARRANGSMRDSQSLLEQLLSFGGRSITAADVHALLGTAAEARLAQMVEHLVNRDAAAALSDLDVAVTEGVDVGQLLEQLLGMFRDAMAAAVGCSAENLMFTSPGELDRLAETSRRLGLETILAIVQIIDQSLARLRFSTQARILAEMALVRICNLENLDELPQLIDQLRNGATPGPASAVSAAAKKKPEVMAVVSSPLSVATDNGPQSTDNGRSAVPMPSLTPENADAIWQQALQNLSDLLSDNASMASSAANIARNRLVVSFAARYNACKTFCERPDQLAKLEKALADVTGTVIKIEFGLIEADAEAVKTAPPPVRSAVRERQRFAEKSEHPLVRRATELFGARLTRIDEPEGA